VTYDYSFLASLRKPVTIVVGTMGVFIAAWVVGRLDVSIGKKM
jgi:oligosaccharyltransferase complex subunit alpha (ribophorin I)